MDLGKLTAVWPCDRVAAGVWRDGSMVASTGDTDHPFSLASVTKLLTAWTVHVAVEEESVGLDDVVTESGATVADVLAHASGLGPDGRVLAEPQTRRIYSNAGYEVVADHVAGQTGMAFAEYLTAGVCAPLGMTATVLDGSPAHGAVSTLDDLGRFALEMVDAALVANTTVERARSPHLPDLAGVLPGYGKQDPNPWGLGPEIRGEKRPHWTGAQHSPSTFGHFGQSGSFVWIDPEVAAACVVLTDLDFGPWAVEAWPEFNDAVLDALP